MALRSKLLDKKVVKSAKEMLKRVRNNAYVAKKLNAVIAAKKHSITAVAKICCISRKAITTWIKHIKFGREEKLFAPPQRRRKTILNQSQLERIELWIEENPNIIALFTIIRTDRNMLLACYSHKHISYRIRTIIRKAILLEK